MATLVRTWLGLAALGAGLIHLAVAAGAPPLLLAAFTALGAAEAAWAVATIARTRPPVPRLALIGAVLPTLLWAVTLVTGQAPVHGGGAHAATTAAAVALPVGPLLAATALDLVVAFSMAIRLRRGGVAAHTSDRELPVWPYLGGVALGATCVCALALTAISGTAVAAFGHGH